MAILHYRSQLTEFDMGSSKLHIWRSENVVFEDARVLEDGVRVALDMAVGVTMSDSMAVV